ncbi:hypothetical protein HELRODRAFT_75559, partial [Helobdella robusta]|uniref:ATP-dependent RNA helicase n=1 Tax=Helobdella robusta TaxID=6412 RepID=T1G264_HELRO
NISKVSRNLPHWLKVPNVVSSDVKEGKVACDEMKHLLDPEIILTLKESQIESFFPVQKQIITELLENANEMTWQFPIGGVPLSDICCSAPTGSGKTLAFVIPIVQILKYSTFRALRCLVVVPVVELASQVYKVFKTFTKNTNLKVGVANGLKSFSAEQLSIIDFKGAYGPTSKVDILVCTPGRLVDHIHSSPHFNLSQLRFLVVDEADRMMEEVKQDWLSHVERAVFQSANQITQNSNDQRPYQFALLRNHIQRPRIQLQKLLFSATLSHNPEKLQLMKLYNPKLFTSVAKRDKSNLKRNLYLGKYVTPVGLKENFVEVDKSRKPLVLLHILKTMPFKSILCFSNSVQSTNRLCSLMKLMEVKACEFSSNLHISKRDRVVKQFNTGKLNLMVCSDAMSRGLDLEAVDCVVSYDVATSLKTYIHRIGRTARAGKEGSAIALLEKKEIQYFKRLLKDGGKEKIKEIKVNQSKLKPYTSQYQKALAALAKTLQTENNKIK